MAWEDLSEKEQTLTKCTVFFAFTTVALIITVAVVSVMFTKKIDEMETTPEASSTTEPFTNITTSKKPSTTTKKPSTTTKKPSTTTKKPTTTTKSTTSTKSSTTTKTPTSQMDITTPTPKSTPIAETTEEPLSSISPTPATSAKPPPPTTSTSTSTTAPATTPENFSFSGLRKEILPRKAPKRGATSLAEPERKGPSSEHDDPNRENTSDSLLRKLKISHGKLSSSPAKRHSLSSSDKRDDYKNLLNSETSWISRLKTRKDVRSHP